MQRIEEHCLVIYKCNDEIIGIIQYNQPAPSEESLDCLAKRISHLFKESKKYRKE